MELVLNLAWVLLAIAMVCLWLHSVPQGATDRRRQMVSLAVLLLILLPAISMTDDLLAAQNPAEVDCCLRRDHGYLNPHAIFPAVPALPVAVFRHAPLRVVRLVEPGNLFEHAVLSPALAAIQNRPPPAA